MPGASGDATRSLISTSLLDYAKTLDCVHCGLCLPHCPTYRETGRESSSPRGRIYLMRGVAEGRIELDALVAAEMHFCLDCRACESACPAGVEYGQLLAGMRAEIDLRGARPRARRFVERLALRHVIGSRRMLGLAAQLLRWYQRSGFQRLVRAGSLLRPLPGLRAAERALPRLPDAHRPPTLVAAEGGRRGRVGFFTGCVMPEFFGPINAATLRVLVRNGFEVHVPRQQCCCGALHRHSGDPLGAERLERQNRSAFHVDDVDAIIVNAAGCGAALKSDSSGLGAKVRDVSEFLVDVGLRSPVGELRLSVAYDDPCHLLHGQRISEAPRALLREIPGLRVIDLPGSSECCGAAGIYNLTHPEMAGQLLARKLAAITETRPDVVATGNPGCLLQIGAGVREAELDIQVMHPVELLARSYAAADAD